MLDDLVLSGREQVLLATLLFFVALLLTVRWELRRTRMRALAIEHRERNNSHSTSPTRRIERELAFVIDFLREFSLILTELQSQHEVRRIPGVLLNGMIRVFKAEQAVVLVRRKNTLTDPDRSNRLVVAALASAERGLKVGSEVPIGEGQLGLVAEAQRVMDRSDFERESGISHKGLSGGGDLVFDVAAPMVVNDETVGVVAIGRPGQLHPRQKEMLQTMAHLGALAWHNVSVYRSAKTAAEVDELTGVFNKAYLKLRLSELVYDARHKATEVSVFMFDIDHFKNYNDRNGHLAGDKLLRLLAQLVTDTVRSDDIFGRFGGEEFLLIMPGRNKEQAMGAAMTVRERIANFDFEHGNRQPLGKVSVSGGVATFPVDASDSVELILVADAALYRAKQKGRNQVCEAQTGLNPRMSL